MNNISIDQAIQVITFRSRLGWFGICGDETGVAGLRFGHASEAEVRDRLDTASLGPAVSTIHDVNSRHDDGPWWEWLPDRLMSYATGDAVAFDDVPLRTTAKTVFQRRVIEATIDIGYGETCTYGELADRAGAPRAARAVGSVMAANRLMLLVPCHRVVPASAGQGGFSAPRGVSLKQELLDMERTTLQQVTVAH